MYVSRCLLSFRRLACSLDQPDHMSPVQLACLPLDNPRREGCLILYARYELQ